MSKELNVTFSHSIPSGSAFRYDNTCEVCYKNKTLNLFDLFYEGESVKDFDNVDVNIYRWYICEECIIDLEKVETMFSLSKL